MNVKVRRAAGRNGRGSRWPGRGARGMRGGRPTRICTLRLNLHRRSNILVLVANLTVSPFHSRILFSCLLSGSQIFTFAYAFNNDIQNKKKFYVLVFLRPWMCFKIATRTFATKLFNSILLGLRIVARPLKIDIMLISAHCFNVNRRSYIHGPLRNRIIS